MRFYQKAFACLWVLPVLFNQQTKAQTTTYTDWSVYGGSKRSIRYSSLRQINTGNVKRLQVA